MRRSRPPRRAFMDLRRITIGDYIILFSSLIMLVSCVAKTCAIAISLRSPSVIRADVSARDRASSVSVTNSS